MAEGLSSQNHICIYKISPQLPHGGRGKTRKGHLCPLCEARLCRLDTGSSCKRHLVPSFLAPHGVGKGVKMSKRRDARLITVPSRAPLSLVVTGKDSELNCCSCGLRVFIRGHSRSGCAGRSCLCDCPQQWGRSHRGGQSLES